MPQEGAPYAEMDLRDAEERRRIANAARLFMQHFLNLTPSRFTPTPGCFRS